MTDINDLNQRIEELELKITFQDDLIEQLNQSLIQQQDDIRNLMRLIEKMGNDMQDLQEASVIDQSQEPPPPHY